LTALLLTCIVHNEMNTSVQCPTCGKLTIMGGYCEQCGKSLNRCPACNAIVLRDAIYCPYCGALISEERKRRLAQQHISWAWWLLPVISPLLLFSPWVGGVINWAFNKDRNRRTARYILFFGILLSIIITIITFMFGWGITI